MLRSLFFIFNVFISVQLYAQSAVTQPEPKTTYQRMQEVLPMHELKGAWQSIDSPTYRIKFQLINGTFSLDSTYHFTLKDSNQICAVGVLMRWPPAYCYATLLDKNLLQLEYSGVANTNPIIYRFKRKD